MKKFTKTISAFVVAVMAAASMSVAASADASYDITFRVEGPESNIYYDTLTVPYDDNLTAAEALAYLDEKSDEVKFTGVDSGYITDVNNISAGKFGGWDGWYYAVNGEAPSVAINDCVLANGDDIVLYYGGYPCQIPQADTSKLDSEGVIVFTSNDKEYDENFNASIVVNKVTDAEVTVNGDKYTTNEDGEIKIPADKLTSELSVQIEKKDESGAPAVLRFAPDYKLSYNGSLTVDTETDTDTSSDTDTDSDSDTDTSSDKDASSNTSSKTTSTSTTTTTTTRTTSTTTTSAVATTATGDGRIYLAVGVFAVAIVIAILMVVLKKKSDKD